MTVGIPENAEVKNVPYGKFGIIAMRGTEEIAKKVDNYIVNWRKEQDDYSLTSLAGYQKESYIIPYSAPRFADGEAKAVINQTVRGYDIFILMDAFNWSVKYKMYGQEVPMSPDDHYSDLKRIIGAINGKAARITVCMPMLYEGRQHRKTGRESMDCAMALQELINMGVDSIITFDAHDPRVCNAIPLNGMENVSPIYQNFKALIKAVPDVKLDKEHILVVSPDEGGMNRAIRYATALGVELGMFYKRRDYTQVVDGRNPIIAHEFLGSNIEGKDVIVVDDMISSGDSMLDVAKKLKGLGANRVYVFASFGLFTSGFEAFDQYYKDGIITKVLCTNLIYSQPELAEKDWFVRVEMSKFMAFILDAMNHDVSIGKLLDPSEKINNLLARHSAELKATEPEQLEMNV